MFKSRRRPYRKPSRQLPLPVFLAAIPLILIILELLARILVGVTGNSAKLDAYEGADRLLPLIALNSLTKQNSPTMVYQTVEVWLPNGV
jgi:hypothetical protein